MRNAIQFFIATALIGVEVGFPQPASADPAEIIERLGGSFRIADELPHQPIVEVNLGGTKCNGKVLTWLDLRHTRITESGIANLRESLPNVPE